MSAKGAAAAATGVPPPDVPEIDIAALEQRGDGIGHGAAQTVFVW